MSESVSESDAALAVAGVADTAMTATPDACSLTLESEDNSATSNNTLIGTLAVDGWAVTFDIARMGLGGVAENAGVENAGTTTYGKRRFSIFFVFVYHCMVK